MDAPDTLDLNIAQCAAQVIAAIYSYLRLHISMLALRLQPIITFLCMGALAVTAPSIVPAQTINPATQLNWPNVTGTGLPRAPCGPSNYGQPYTDTASNLHYVCSASGWTEVGSCSSMGAYNAKACGGAYGDMSHATCKASAGSRVLSDCVAMSTHFIASMVGEPIYIASAGGIFNGRSVTLKTTIAAYTNGGQVTLATAALGGAATAGPNVIWGHDDTSKLQAAYDTASSQARALYIPRGDYLHHGLDFTGGHGRAAQHLIYGDGYGSTNLWAIAVTDPGNTQPYSLSVGVDLSVASETAIHDIAFFGGGMNTRGTTFADLAPGVNVFCGRQAQTDGNPLSILHTWDNVYTETLGPYDVVWDGCEQTNLVDSHFQTDSDDPVAAFYLTNVNAPHFASPWVRIIAPGAASGNTMTKLAFSGARTSFVGRGNMVVLDEGTSNGIFK